MRTDPAGVEEKWVGDLIALGQQLAVCVGRMAVQKTLINGVVNDFNPRRRNVEELFNFAFGEL